MKYTITTITTFLGSLALASAQVIQSAGTNVSGQAIGGGIRDILILIQNTANALVPILITIAVVCFFYGLITYVIANRNGAAEKANSATKFMGVAILSLFIMVAIWGIIYFIAGTLGIGVGGSVPVPQTPRGL
jgi:hypothetical protein